MRKTVVFLLLLIALISIVGCIVPEPVEPVEPVVNFTILGWEQSYYEFLLGYSAVEISYKVENTGHINVDFYKLWFEVTCVDGSRFRESTGGFGVDVGKYVTDFTFINTMNKQAVTVEMTDYELTVY